MRISLIATALSLFAFVSLAEDDLDMEIFGGYVRKPGSARGKVVVLNSQRRIEAKDLAGALSEIDLNVKAPYELKTVANIALPLSKPFIASHGGTVCVALVDVPDYPALLTAPEDGWSVVNVAALAKDGPSPAVLASRMRKELLRGFALAGGCAFLSRGPIVLRGDIREPKDLDRIKSESYGVDAFNGFDHGLPNFGVRPWSVYTYEDACQGGWAPQPTNQWQKAIWDKVHAPPSKPLKITFDPATQNGKVTK